MDQATNPILRSASSDTNRSKRVRIAPEHATGAPEKPTPYAKAKFAANVTIASLPLTIKSIAEHLSLSYLKSKSSLARLEKAKLRLADDSFIPHSARINFTVGTTARAREAFPDKFKLLQERVETENAVFISTCKDNIKRSLEIELKTLLQDTTAIFCKAVKTLATCVAIAQAGFGATWTNLLVQSTFVHHMDVLLQ